MGLVRPRSSLQTECGKQLMAKTGNITELKERILQRQLSTMTDKDLAKYMPKSFPETSKKLPSGSGATSSATGSGEASATSASKSTGPVPGHQAPAAGEGGQAGHGAADGEDEEKGGQGKGGEPLVLFGRQSLELKVNEKNDKTDFFQTLEDGPNEVTEEAAPTQAALLEMGEHGVIPVAALVKVFQGFHEPNGESHFALFLAGLAVACLCMSMLCCALNVTQTYIYIHTQSYIYTLVPSWQS